MSDAELARNYILDKLSEEDRDECERRFLFDPDFEMLVLETETDLFDDFARRRLNRDEADAIRRRAARSPHHADRLNWARSLQNVSAAVAGKGRKSSPLERLRNQVAKPFSTSISNRIPVFLGGLAAVAILSFAIVYTVLPSLRNRAAMQNRNPSSAASSSPLGKSDGPVGGQIDGKAGGRNEGSVSTQRAATPPVSASSGHPSRPVELPRASPLAATFVLMANEQRGEMDEQTISPPPGATAIRLQLTTEEGLDASLYAATVRDASGTTIFTSTHLTTLKRAGRRYVQIEIAATPVPAGEYSIELVQENAPAGKPALSYRFAAVKR